MASGASFQLKIDDEDVFDWAEAMREIDVACGAGKEEEPAAVSNLSSRFNCDQQIAEKPVELMREERQAAARVCVSSTKQSKLDRFMSVPSSNSNRYMRNDVRNGDISDGSLWGNLDKKNAEDVEMLNEFVKIDLEAAKTWIYPVNVPLRDYQFSITLTSLFSNTMVVLPTGLGKTLIAAVVMYNYFRWFPEGKIVFAAPSRPLVLQQIEACHKIVGIPQEWTIDLTGLTSPTRRADLWKTKRVFFVTPQVLERDIHSGSCSVNQLVCMVIDEAHRAMGNYSYCVAVRELMDNHVQLRILALTATPGYKKQTIQLVIDNLQISSLEYRTESDADVLPYVHDRKIELIEVPMGNVAVEINRLLLEVVRPFVSRLSALGVHLRRDIETLSTCELLSSRDKYLQAQPPNLRDIEGYFGVLITLCHIRDLLSSHGITPAFQKLDEKMKQGYFARFMSRNDILLKTKTLMEQAVSTGVPSPKLSKMLEVLIDHFKVRDPQNSRVIIFSNFRDSVSALKGIGEFVKATEFIGQSSGKTTKGQSQKVQQAVLQKFREGGYNIIVATSIGEEGLDIMEVDLVICFDANVSPLRMIQRMGRTGRQHKGRVVVLACEGSELKGYMNKQAKSKTIKKFMKNGGRNSFNFHPSPRMIPHVVRPEAIFLEMSIEEFVHRGKKLKDDSRLPLPECKTKLTNSEKNLLAKYFASGGKIAWRPSLIAYPHFQAFPSHISKLGHSSRTHVLIDSMKNLLRSKFSEVSKTVSAEEEDIISDSCLRDEMAELQEKVVEDSESSDDPAEERHNARALKPHLEPENISKDINGIGFNTKNTCHGALSSHVELENPTVDAATNFLRSAAIPPSLKLNSECNKGIRTASSKHDFEDCKEYIAPNDGNPHSHSRFQEVEYVPRDTGYDPSGQNSELLPCGKEVFCTPVSHRIHTEMRISGLSHDKNPIPLADEVGNDLPDADLGPKLTDFIQSGIVPESPINNSESENEDLSPRLTSFIRSGIVPESPINHSGMQNGDTSHSTVSPTLVSLVDLQNQFMRTTENGEKTPEASTPLIPVEQQCKYRRLRKIGDLSRKVIAESRERNILGRKLSRETTYRTPKGRIKVEKKREPCAAMFFEEEAEDSLPSSTSSDKEVSEDNSSYEGSFIDDGSNSISNTQAGVGGTEMMGIYRRSLLSQSPLLMVPVTATKSDSDSIVQSYGMNDCRSPSGGKQSPTLQTGLESTARNSHVLCKRTLSRIVSPESRKRSMRKVESISKLNLDMDDFQKSPMQIQMPRVEECSDDIFDDDNFFEGIDLDAVEREAARLIKYKSEFPTRRIFEKSELIPKEVETLSSPSFDLGV